MIVFETRLGPVRIIQTGRAGGVSTGQYATANLADYFEDERALDNREILATKIRVSADEFCWMQQTHSASVADAEPGVIENTDALVTTVAGRPIGALTADCAPIVLVADDAVGIVHAGWLGLSKGVVQNAVAALLALTDGPISAYLGPCIRPENYEFGFEELNLLALQFGEQVIGQTSWGAPALDLPAAVQSALEVAGVDEMIDSGIDTYADSGYFSFRRDKVQADQATIAILEQ